MIVGPDPYIDYLIRFWSIFVATLNFNFQGQMWNLLYLSQKWSDCHEMKTKHIDWTLGHKCDHQAWHWPWPWPWKFKYGICFISQPKVVRRLSVRIYLILTGVTSDVSVPLTHLVQSINQSIIHQLKRLFNQSINYITQFLKIFQCQPIILLSGCPFDHSIEDLENWAISKSISWSIEK